jgi:hypothetical protein
MAGVPSGDDETVRVSENETHGIAADALDTVKADAAKSGVPGHA